jgi:pimeloyl-ACP methyl ester carboxylesterase
MDSLTPFFRDQGSGEAVICLHSNASTSSQWRTLSDLLSNRYRVIAVDGYGAGKSPPWPTDFSLRLDDEVKLLDAILRQAGDRFHVVGHSYGGAVAMKLAALYPKRVRSLAIYEPTLFHLVAGADPLRSPAEGIWRAATDAAQAIERGDSLAAAERFIDFWMGQGSWAAMPAARQAGVAASVQNVKGWRDVLFAETVPASTLASLDIPVLLLYGENSPRSSKSVARILQDTLTRVTVAPQPGLGHMGPITHAESVNQQIAEFLDRH